MNKILLILSFYASFKYLDRVNLKACDYLVKYMNFYYRATLISRYFYFRLSKHIHMCMELWSMDRASNFLLNWSSSRSKSCCVLATDGMLSRNYVILYFFLLNEVHSQYFFITQLILVQFFWQLKNEIIYYSNIVQIEPPN